MNDILTDAQFKAMYPLLTTNQRNLYLPYLNLAMAQFGINTERMVSQFNAHLEIESFGLTRFFENLSYSAKRLMQVWPNRFPTLSIASQYAGQPERLAEKVYGGRLGNKNPGDAYKYRGTGPMQFTGKDVFIEFDAYAKDILNLDANFIINPGLICQPQYMFLASAWFMAVYKKAVNSLNEQTINHSTLIINGGYNGLAERNREYKNNLRILSDDFKLKSFDDMKAYYDGKLESFTSSPEHDKAIATIPTNDHLADSDITAKIPDVEPIETNEEENTPTTPTNADETPSTKMEIKDGVITGETNPSNKPPEKVAVIEKPSRLKYIWHQLTAMVTGNIGLDGFFNYMGQIKAWGLPDSFWTNLIWFVVIGCLIGLTVVLIRWFMDRRQTLKLAELNSTPDNKATIAKPEDVETLKANGYKLIYQTA